MFFSCSAPNNINNRRCMYNLRITFCTCKMWNQRRSHTEKIYPNLDGPPSPLLDSRGCSLEEKKVYTINDTLAQTTHASLTRCTYINARLADSRVRISRNSWAGSVGLRWTTRKQLLGHLSPGGGSFSGWLGGAWCWWLHNRAGP